MGVTNSTLTKVMWTNSTTRKKIMIISTDDTSKSLGIVWEVKSSAKEGAFLHRHGISFHLSHLPLLYICVTFVVKAYITK